MGQFVLSGASWRLGTILGSLAVMLAGGGEHISDLDILRAGPVVFGNVASNMATSQFFESSVGNLDLFDYGFAMPMRELRSSGWEAAGGRNFALTAPVLDPLVIDLDATVVTSHSPKEQPGHELHLLAATHCPAHRAPGHGMGSKTVALPALRHGRKIYHRARTFASGSPDDAR